MPEAQVDNMGLRRLGALINGICLLQRMFHSLVAQALSLIIQRYEDFWGWHEKFTSEALIITCGTAEPKEAKFMIFKGHRLCLLQYSSVKKLYTMLAYLCPQGF